MLDTEYKVEEKKIVQYELSPFLYKHQKEVVNKALNENGYGLFLDTGCGKTLCGIEIAKHLGKTLVSVSYTHLCETNEEVNIVIIARDVFQMDYLITFTNEEI